MTVICTLPIQIPVHRVRIVVRCLQTGGPVHTAVLRLADYYGDSPEEIAEPLGLPIPRVQQLLAELDEGGEPVEREFVMWVDHARGQVLPYNALTGVAAKPHPTGGIQLPLDPPTPAMLENMGLSGGLSWDVGLEGYIEVHQVLDVTADIRAHSLPHVLRLPDTHLVVTSNEVPYQPPGLTITQHGVDDALLTHWAREHFTDHLQDILKTGDLSNHALSQQVTSITGQVPWDTKDPHPGVFREQITEAVEQATQRVALAAPRLAFIPTWLEQLLQDADDRGIPVLLCPAKDDLAPRYPRFQFTTTSVPGQPPTLVLIADDAHAVIHTDPAACLDRRTTPVRQHLYSTRDHTAISALLGKLGLKRLAPRPPRNKLTPQRIASMLAGELKNLQSELPSDIRPAILATDEKAAAEALDRYTTERDPTKAMYTTIAGVAWERLLIARVSGLCASHPEIQVIAERWKPTGVPLDLDVILHDTQKQIVWILDAKNSDKDNRQLESMKRQIKILKKTPELTHDCPTIIGLIVHRNHQLTASAEPTEHHNIHRCTLQGLPDLLLAKRLPGERAQTKQRGREAA